MICSSLYRFFTSDLLRSGRTLNHRATQIRGNVGAYRFEAYTPAAKRRYGHYALPLLWRDQVIGWANASAQAGRLQLECGYISGRAPREAAFRRALEEERSRMAGFLAVAD
jgi:uncharacterized protein YcaQ